MNLNSNKGTQVSPWSFSHSEWWPWHNALVTDVLVARLVERAVGERQDVRAQDLEEVEVAALVHLELLNELYAQ